MYDDRNQRLIPEALKFYRETVDWLEGHHADFARKAELDLAGNDRPSAMWKLAGESIGAARALVDLLNAGYTTQTFTTMRAIHESNRPSAPLLTSRRRRSRSAGSRTRR